jgi:hypothetical protein
LKQTCYHYLSQRQDYAKGKWRETGTGDQHRMRRIVSIVHPDLLTSVLTLCTAIQSCTISILDIHIESAPALTISLHLDSPCRYAKSLHFYTNNLLAQVALLLLSNADDVLLRFATPIPTTGFSTTTPIHQHPQRHFFLIHQLGSTASPEYSLQFR